jgi:hypothetical protein
MSVKQTYTLTRPNTGVDWYPIPEKFHKLRGKYEKSGKRLILSKVISEDGLKMTTVALFDSYESRFDFNEEDVAQEFFNARDIYCIENNITASAANEEVDD